MKKNIYKLIRNKIPDIIKKKGQIPVVRKLSETEFSTELKNKLLEESEEIKSANSKDELKEEIADLFEVLYSLVKTENLNIKEIDELRDKKNLEKGSFNERMFLESVEE